MRVCWSCGLLSLKNCLEESNMTQMRLIILVFTLFGDHAAVKIGIVIVKWCCELFGSGRDSCRIVLD